MERRKKALICLFLLVSLILPRVKIVRAEALPEVMEGTATVADMVMTYYAESGSAIANTEWINTLYNDLGTNFGTVEALAEQGLLVLNENTGMWESTGQLATAIENTSAYASLHLNEIFNVSAEEAAELGGGAVAATGGTILGNAAAGVASIGTVPLLGAVTASYWAGIGIGTLIAHKLGLYGEDIQAGIYITTPQNIRNNMYSGGRVFTARGYSDESQVLLRTYCLPPGLYLYCQQGSVSQTYGQQYKIGILNKNSDRTEFKEISYLGNVSSVHINAYQNNYPYDTSNFGYTDGMPVVADAYQYADDLAAGRVTYPPAKSPDLIGQEGNLEAENENGNITVPDMLPQIDTSVEAGKPLRLQDWLNFANQANTNTGGGQPDLNKDLFDDILDRIKTLIPVIPDPGPNPDPGGQTRPVPTPTPVPDPDYDVPQPEQPEWQSETTQQTEEVPDSIPTGKPWVVEGLQNKFPFCIPWDIKNMLGKFASASRQAPYIQWRFNPPFTPIDYTFQIDLADFEDAAAILRTLELIAFIVGLAFATRYLIGAT